VADRAIGKGKSPAEYRTGPVHFQRRFRLTTRRGSIDYAEMSKITKDCFGTVIASLKKMKECVRCELLAECRAINWKEGEAEEPPAVVRRSPRSGDTSSSSPA